MTVEQLIKELQQLPPESSVQIEDDSGYHHKIPWLMHYKGELTIGWTEGDEENFLTEA